MSGKNVMLPMALLQDFLKSLSFSCKIPFKIRCTQQCMFQTIKKIPAFLYIYNKINLLLNRIKEFQSQKNSRRTSDITRKVKNLRPQAQVITELQLETRSLDSKSSVLPLHFAKYFRHTDKATLIRFSRSKVQMPKHFGKS